MHFCDEAAQILKRLDYKFGNARCSRALLFATVSVFALVVFFEFTQHCVCTPRATNHDLHLPAPDGLVGGHSYG